MHYLISKCFENGGKNMSCFIRHDEVWDKYDKIWDVIKDKLSIKFHSEPDKLGIKFHGESV